MLKETLPLPNRRRSRGELVRLLLCLSLFLIFVSGLEASDRKTENLILITLDGARVEEMFHGIDPRLLEPHAKGKPVEDLDLHQSLWAESPEERRARLLPFFWKVWMQEHGSIAGDRWNGSEVLLTNRHLFSYPGYAEILTGTALDDAITSNAPIQIPSPTILEFIQQALDLPRERIAAFASWSVMEFIAESRPGTIFSNAGYAAYAEDNPAIQQLSALQFHTRSPWDSVRHDVYTFRFALHHLKTHRPKVLYIALGETDDWGHEKRYDRVLQAFQQTDEFFRELWEFVESDPQYRDKTTILLSTDHGRGMAPDDWMHHRDSVPGSEYTWIAVVSPDHTARGPWKKSQTVHMNQIAATLAEFLGLDYSKSNPEAGPPIELFLK